MTTDYPSPADSSDRTSAPDDCCTVDPRIAQHFDKAMLERAATGEFPEMVHVSQRVLEMLADVHELRPTVLELGAGSGGLSVALLERGAAAADGVDLSPESVATARRRAEAAGVAERASFQLGDGAQVPLSVHDWVILDRVICCYPNLDALLANAVGAAARRFCFSIPASTGWRGLVTRTVVALENATNRFRGRPCPSFVHDVRRIEARLAAAGFARLREAPGGMWYAAVWERPAP
jgi:magnesium-protoporphyrin O-methyltransferase